MIIKWASKQPTRSSQEHRKRELTATLKFSLHSLARFAAHGIIKIPLTKFQNLHPRKCLKVVVQRREKKPLVAQFGGIPLQRKQEAILVDRQPQFLMTNRSELLQRVLADRCELCGSKEHVEVHHIRKLADLKKPGRKQKPEWMKQMATRRRKTLVVCRKCHEDIHAGKTTTPFRKQGLESRVRGKLACSVREEGNGEGP